MAIPCVHISFLWECFPNIYKSCYTSNLVCQPVSVTIIIVCLSATVTSIKIESEWNELNYQLKVCLYLCVMYETEFDILLSDISKERL